MAKYTAKDWEDVRKRFHTSIMADTSLSSPAQNLDTDDWPMEAEWNPAGALCFTDHHRATTEIECDTHPEVDCGNLEHFSTGTLLMNELP